MIDVLRVISLDRTPRRFAQFLEWNPGIEVSRVPAFDGALLDRAACVRDGLLAGDNQYLPGAIGAAMSHVALWRQCAAGSTPFHIAEDDVVLRADFRATAGAALDAVPDCDVALWTHNFDWPLKIRPAPGVGSAVVQYDPAEARQDAAAFRSFGGQPAMVRLVSAAGAGCYSVTPRGAARMLADCLPLGNVAASYAARPEVRWANDGIDVEMSRHYGDWRAYVSLPPLAMAPNDQAASTIRGHLAAMHDPALANFGQQPG